VTKERKKIAAFMTFDQILKSFVNLIDSKLRDLLTHHNEKYHPPNELAEAMRYAVLGGGKRIRPFLVVQSAKLFGAPESKALTVAAAIECIHCYSLIHDDLPAMDNDELRRGRPTLHIAFDEATAILAGDALLTLAFEILSRPETHESDLVRIQLISGLAKAAGWEGMAGGQCLDLQAENQQITDIETIKQIQSMKTGALIRFACIAGAILANAPNEDRQALERYGNKLGLAFQLADDLLDIEGDIDRTGKATHKDVDAGKATIVSLLGPDQSRNLLGEIEASAIKDLSKFGEKAKVLIETARFVTHRQY
jgi:farnesyl diphosphate synthase